MDTGIVIGMVGSAVTIVGAVMSLFLWNRSEANADRRDIVNLVLAIQSEIRDFHNRLIEIERKK